MSWRQQVDTLFVDEAGQLSLANVIAVSGSARSLVLLGDPQQLSQVKKGAHPEGVDVSALEFALGGGAVIDPTQGPLPAGDASAPSGRQPLHERGLLRAPAARRTRDEPPAPQRTGGADRDRDALVRGGPRGQPQRERGGGCGRRGPVPEPAPRHLDQPARRAALARPGSHSRRCPVQRTGRAPHGGAPPIAARQGGTARVGTVDKIQGQQAAVVLYSLATSSQDELPRSMEFLYSLNRLNVATSRGRCMAVVIGSPDLLRVSAHTPFQMRLANALCRFVELAAESRAGEDATSRPLTMPWAPG